MIDSLSHSVSRAVQSNTVTCCRDIFNQLVISSFEKATNIFQLANDLFQTRNEKMCFTGQRSEENESTNDRRIYQ